jgi:hypothetical protein
MKLKNQHVYYVTGSGLFPTDMLRYDQASAIYAFDHDGRTFHVIVGERPPTMLRWNSFLWTVIETPIQMERWSLPVL